MCNAILFLFLFLVSKNSSCLQILQSNLDLMHLNPKRPQVNPPSSRKQNNPKKPAAVIRIGSN